MILQNVTKLSTPTMQHHIPKNFKLQLFFESKNILYTAHTTCDPVSQDSSQHLSAENRMQ